MVAARLSWICTASLLGAWLSGCEPYGRATMYPGVDCLQCHSAPASAIPGACAAVVGPNGPFCNAAALPWTAAGTVLSDVDADPDGGGVPDVHILLQDALGKRVNLTSNSVGNFFTAEPLVYEGTGATLPFTVQIEYQGQCKQMTLSPLPSILYQGTAIDGAGCNRCHSPGASGTPGSVPAPGYLSIPQGNHLPPTLAQWPCADGDGGVVPGCSPLGLSDECDGGFWGTPTDLP